MFCADAVSLLWWTDRECQDIQDILDEICVRDILQAQTASLHHTTASPYYMKLLCTNQVCYLE